MWDKALVNEFSEKETTVRANARHEVIDVAHIAGIEHTRILF